MQKKIGINYGLLAKKIEEQANDQGLTLGKGAESCQKDLDSIHRLYTQNFISDYQFQQLLKKINKKVSGFLKELE